MRFVIEIDQGTVPLDQLAHETRRISQLLSEGFTSGQVVGEEGEHRGWWTVEE